MNEWSQKTELPATRLVDGLGMARSKYHQWRRRYGKVNEHNAWMPRDHWLEDWEKEAIIAFSLQHRQEGYRRITYMLMDADIVAVSPSSVYRVLKAADLLNRWNRSPSQKGAGFDQPARPHEHWHTDISYVNICGTFYYLFSILDGFSRYIIHWEIRTSMTEADAQIVLQRGRERFPDARARLISDNGSQFIALGFKELIRLCGMTHVRTSPSHPQSNGKQERWYATLKSECIRPGTPLSLEDARRLVAGFVDHYNQERLHSAIGYVTPKDKLEGRAEAILAARERKLEAARAARKARRMAGGLTEHPDTVKLISAGETEAGSAGERPARDSRSGGDENRPGGAPRSPELPPQRTGGYSEPSPMPWKTPGSGAEPRKPAFERTPDGPESLIHERLLSNSR